MWKYLHIVFSLASTWGGYSLIKCFENWLKLEKVYTTLPSIVCWYIWLERNKCIFDKFSPTVQGVSIQIRGMVNITSEQTIQKRTLKRNKKTPDITLESSCWFDGAA